MRFGERIRALRHFVVLGEKHLNYLVASYVRYYLGHRPHQGLGNALLDPGPEPPEAVPPLETIRCRSRLGGLLKSYSRKAA